MLPSFTGFNRDSLSWNRTLLNSNQLEQDYNGFSSSSTQFLPSFTGYLFHCVATLERIAIGVYRVIAIFTEFYGYTALHWGTWLRFMGAATVTEFVPSFFFLFLVFFSVVTEFYGFYRVLPSFFGFITEFYGRKPRLIGSSRIVTGLLPGFSRFYLVFTIFTDFYLNFTSFHNFYLVLPSFTGLYWVLPTFTWI